MAQPTYLSEISSEFQPELTDIQRKQKLAELLMQRGMTQPQGQMVGGRFVAPSMAERLAGLFNVYSGRNLQETTEERQKALAEQLRNVGVQEIQKFNELLQSNPQEAYQFAQTARTPELKAIGLKKMLPQELTLKPGERHMVISPTGESKTVAEVPERPVVVGNNLVDPLTGKVVYTAPKEYKGQLVETAGGFMEFDPNTRSLKPLLDASGQPVMGNKANLPEGATKQVTGATNLKQAIDNYKNTLKNFKTLDMANPNARAVMSNAYNNMMLQAKEAYNLGVLNGPDYKILTSIVNDPTSFGSAFVSKKTLEQQADQLSNTADTIISNAYKSHNRPVPAQYNQPVAQPQQPKVVDFNSLK